MGCHPTQAGRVETLTELNLLDGVQAFMTASGQLDTPPTFDDDQLRHLRYTLLEEEYNEWVDADCVDDHVEMIDGLLDICIVAWGSVLAFLGPEKARAAAAEVTRSNLAKVVGGRVLKNADGKIQKPAGWSAPDIAGVIG